MFLRNQVFVWKFKNFDKLQLPYSLVFFCWNFAHISYLPMPTKGCVGFFVICLDLELFAKNYIYIIYIYILYICIYIYNIYIYIIKFLWSMANKCIHTYMCIRSCPFSQNISFIFYFWPQRFFRTDFSSSYKKYFEYTGNCVYKMWLYLFVRAGFR